MIVILTSIWGFDWLGLFRVKGIRVRDSGLGLNNFDVGLWEFWVLFIFSFGSGFISGELVLR